MLPRRFALVRRVDDAGVAGVSVVAFGIAFSDDHVVLRWCSAHPATSAWNSLDDMLAVHGNEDTGIQWIDTSSAELDDLATASRQGRRARRRALRSDDEAEEPAALTVPDLPANGFQRPPDPTESAADTAIPASRQPGRHRRASQVEQSV
jgi:hypothetical protein